MKNKTIKKVLLGGIMTLMFACNSKKEEPPAVVVDKEQIKKEIQAKEDSFADVYNSGELRDIGYYADDATSFFQNRAPLVGKEAIVSFLKSDIVSNTDRISFAIVLLLAYLAAYLFIKYDDKRIEAEVKEAAIHNGQLSLTGAQFLLRLFTFGDVDHRTR